MAKEPVQMLAVCCGTVGLAVTSDTRELGSNSCISNLKQEKLSSVDSSVPSILPSQGSNPRSPSMLFTFIGCCTLFVIVLIKGRKLTKMPGLVYILSKRPVTRPL